jgi:hypothetical protein
VLLNKPERSNQDKQMQWNVQIETGQNINGNLQGTDRAGNMVK